MDTVYIGDGMCAFSCFCAYPWSRWLPGQCLCPRPGAAAEILPHSHWEAWGWTDSALVWTANWPRSPAARSDTPQSPLWGVQHRKTEVRKLSQKQKTEETLFMYSARYDWSNFLLIVSQGLGVASFRTQNKDNAQSQNKSFITDSVFILSPPSTKKHLDTTENKAFYWFQFHLQTDPSPWSLKCWKSIQLKSFVVKAVFLPIKKKTKSHSPVCLHT